MIEKLKAITERFHEVERSIFDPGALQDMKAYTALNKEYKKLAKIVDLLSKQDKPFFKKFKEVRFFAVVTSLFPFCLAIKGDDICVIEVVCGRHRPGVARRLIGRFGRSNRAEACFQEVMETVADSQDAYRCTTSCSEFCVIHHAFVPSEVA